MMGRRLTSARAAPAPLAACARAMGTSERMFNATYNHNAMAAAVRRGQADYTASRWLCREDGICG